MKPALHTLRRFMPLLASATLVGCLLPMPIEEELDEVAHPPTVDPRQLTPPPSTVVVYQPTPGDVDVEFSTGPITDPNTEDRLFYRWYLDYAPPPSPKRRFVEQSAAAGLGPDQRSDGVRANFDPCIEFTTADVQHRVDLIVSDRPFEDTDDNQTLPDDAGSFRVTWFFTYEDDQCDR